MRLLSCVFMSVFMSLTVMANTSTNEVDGVVIQSECREGTPYGFVVLQAAHGDDLTSTWYKINSDALCKKDVESAWYPESVTKLTAISADNMAGDAMKITRLAMNSAGEVVGIVSESVAIEASVDFKTHHILAQESVMSWYENLNEKPHH